MANNLDAMDASYEFDQEQKCLVMNEKGIDKIDPQFLTRFDHDFLKNVVCLDLSGNKIKHIAAGTFESLINLKVLKLQNNCLEFVASGIFGPVTKRKQLHTIDLSFNRLKVDYPKPL